MDDERCREPTKPDHRYQETFQGAEDARQQRIRNRTLEQRRSCNFDECLAHADQASRSDRSRASVTRELRRTRIDNGILGDIRFDRKGDLAEGPVSFFVVEGRRFVVDRVITARSSLLR